MVCELGRRRRVLVLPGVGRGAAEVEELEGALGAVHGGDVAVGSMEVSFKFVLNMRRTCPWVMHAMEVLLAMLAGGGLGGLTHMCFSCFGTMSLSSPTRALPVARTRFSPLDVSGMSELPVCFPDRDHSVSPCRIMKQRGAMVD